MGNQKKINEEGISYNAVGSRVIKWKREKNHKIWRMRNPYGFQNISNLI